MESIPKRLLIIQLRRIGDVLLSTPVVRAIKLRYPGVHLAFLTESESRSLLENNPFLDEPMVWESGQYSNPAYVARILRGLREKRFDTVIDLQGSPRTALASFLSGAKNRIGFDYRGRELFYNIKVKRDPLLKYGSAFKLDILKPLGLSSDDFKPEIYLTAEAIAWGKRFFSRYQLADSDFKVALSPVSRRPYKRWPLENFSKLSSWLASNFAAKVILLWGPGERPMAEKVAENAGTNVLVSDQTQSLQEAAALIQSCNLFIGNDNGLKHLATAVSTPTFTIYGPSDPASWTYPDPHNHRFIKGFCSCRGRQKGKCPGPVCLTSVSVEQVRSSLSPLVEEIISRKVTKKLAQA
jgi:lipopolysaccharide heptosyltransferase II